MVLLRQLFAFLFIVEATNCAIAMDDESNSGSCARTRQYKNYKQELIPLPANIEEETDSSCESLKINLKNFNLGRQLSPINVQSDMDETNLSESLYETMLYGGASNLSDSLPSEVWSNTLRLS